MGLSRLDNFLKNSRGEILYVDPSNIDSTDSILNQGNSLARPFKTIQRALIEAARFSYQSGLDNDRFGKTTIMLYPGEHVVDNRPGWIPYQSNDYYLRNGSSSNDFPPFDLTTNFSLDTPNNALYKLNSVHGGVIVPRGTSIVGMDLRKTKIRPTYVPNPENDNIERSAVFRVTGACYFWQFTILDADPNGTCFIDYTTNQFVPNFSHHKLTAFEYADGVNGVKISDTFLTYSTNRTDLDIYYEKIGLAYGQSSGRPISPDYPSSTLDIQTKVDEYRIVGSRGAEVGISSIRAGDGVTATNVITATLSSELEGLDVDTPIRISGVGAAGYDGQYVVSEVVATGANPQVSYQVQNPPVNPLPSVSGATLNISVDTVTSASPYIFNISLRSVYGMCGLHADGSKADGFKSMVVAQFTGIGLQKDDKAFVKYDPSTGIYQDYTASGNENIHSDSRARFKPEYENFHIKCDNDAYLQIVSVFAIGYSNHFLADSGGDQSINNSNSNFGAKALVARGFRSAAFPRDDIGYITHIIPPKHLDISETSTEYISIDVAKTVSVGSTNKLFLYGYENESVAPDSVIEGYRIGAKINDQLNVLISNAGVTTQYSARIIMPNTEFSGNEITSEKDYTVGRSVGINSITSNVLTFTQQHSLVNGESIRVISENGDLPNGIDSNVVYYAITSGVSADQIKIAKNLNDAINDTAIVLNNSGGTLHVVSRVSDKSSGSIGHPIQYDSTNQQWYINVATASTENTIYPIISSLGTGSLGAATPRTFITRKPDTRNLIDTIYRARFVIPADSPITARPPLDGYIIQESNSVIGISDQEVQYQYNPGSVTLSNSTELRNPRIISGADWSSNIASINTELPHNLTINDQVEIVNIISSNNTTGVANSAFNGVFSVVGISSTKQFSIGINTNPGTFQNNISLRTTSLPVFKKKKSKDTFLVYRSSEVQKYVPGEQDGVYHLLLVNSSNSPNIAPFESLEYSQPITNLYPQTNRDNPVSNYKTAKSFALPDPIGQVVVNDPQYSITKETLEKQLVSSGVGIALTEILSNDVGTAHTLYSSVDHGLNRITSVGIVSTGFGYGSGTSGTLYNARLVGIAGSTTGVNATARISFDASGQLTSVKIIDGGSAYGIGNSMQVVGVATTAGHIVGIVSVTQIYNNVGDTLNLHGVSGFANDEFNTQYRITGITSFNQINVSSASTISVGNTTGLGSTVTANAIAYLSGRSLNVSSLVYDRIVGIATITTAENHGLNVFNSIVVGGADDSFFNGDFIVQSVVGLTTFVANIGVSTYSPATTGSIYVYDSGFSSNSGNITNDDENIGGRQEYIYSGITTTLLGPITSRTATVCDITNVENLNLQIGDYLQIDDEIVRIKTTVASNPISIYRGVFGTPTQTHVVGSVVRKIKVLPVELRRNSLIRASGHTFEYLGFGPGNYSTAFPERQDRTITAQEELLAQSNKQSGGVVVFTGMNADGDFYVGNKKVSSNTGQEEVFDAPVPSVTGEDISSGALNIGFDVLTPLEVSISRSVRVEGGPDNNIISEFDGPVIFNNKITSTSDKGIEAASLFLQGDVTISRKYSVSDTKPTLAGNPGDVVYRSNPTSNGYLGWVYTTNNIWEQFGAIGANGGSVPSNAVGVATGGGGFFISTAINLSSSGISIEQTYDSVSGISTVNLEVDATAPPQLVVAGLSTFNSLVDINQGVIVDNGLTVNTGVSTFNSTLDINSSVDVSGGLSASIVNSTNANINSANINIFSAGISTFNGDIIVGDDARAADTFVRILSGDNYSAGLEAYGNSQGTGYLFVGESSVNGGGLFYNGDGSPAFATGETADTIAYYRKSSGTNEVVFSYPQSSNTVTFRGDVVLSSNANIVGVVTAAGASISGAISGGSATISGNVSAGSSITSSSSVFDSKGNVRSVPTNSQGGTYTLVAADAGKIVTAAAGVTIPAGVFENGDAISVYNTSAGNITITASGVTLTQVVSGSTGNRTLAAKGLCTIVCIGSNNFIISGAGLS